jgi:diguanylate cyclase (GGDEF)-like protein/PAS domain S-box-containing protein
MEHTAATGSPPPAATQRKSAGTIPDAWVVDTLADSSDLVIAIDAETTIRWCNATALPMLGYEPESVVGRSFADFVHPDDLGRAAEVMALTLAGAFDDSPITPAVYRVRTADDRWLNLEVNGSANADGGMLLIGRFGGDLVLTDRLLEAVSANEPFEGQVALVIELGQWRHPTEGYAILYRGEHDEPRSLASNLPSELHQPGSADGRTPWDAAMATGGEVAIADLTELSPDSPVASPELVAVAIEAGYVGCIAAPVHDPAHPGGACLLIWTTEQGPTTSGHRYAVGNMRRAFALVLQQRAQLRSLERAARVDQLTGLTARARFLELLDQIGSEAEPTARHALLYVDLDGFKTVNDNLGHTAGDQVLNATAARVTGAVAPDAVVSRLGGDEFGILCPPGTTEAEAAATAQRIVDAVALPIVVGEVSAVVGASVGVAVGTPGDHPAAVLDAADGALLGAKAEGRGRWRSAS